MADMTSDPTTIELFLDSMKSASGIARELVGLVKERNVSAKISEINTKILEAQSLALSAQADQFVLSKNIADLEEKLTRINQFRSQKKDYELQSVGDVAFAYVYNPPADAIEPVHWLCSTCCDQDRKSVLQFYTHDIGRSRGLDIWKCHVCNSEIRVPGGTRP